jgi:1-acyl-sn-glycerol-3-phosphate acyltransferase
MASWWITSTRAVSTLITLSDCRREVREIVRPQPREAGLRALWLRHASARVGGCLRLAVSVRGEIPDAPSLIAANHLSYLDPLAIGQLVPLTAVAKSELAQWPAIGETLEELGIIFVERGNAMSGAIALRKAMRTLHAGVSVLVFPEGTTTFGDDVLPFARGAFGIARRLGIPVVPVTLRYDRREVCWVGDASLLPHAARLHKHEQIGVELVFGAPIEPMDFADAGSLAAATRERIRSNARR